MQDIYLTRLYCKYVGFSIIVGSVVKMPSRNIMPGLEIQNCGEASPLLTLAELLYSAKLFCPQFLPAVLQLP